MTRTILHRTGLAAAAATTLLALAACGGGSSSTAAPPSSPTSSSTTSSSPTGGSSTKSPATAVITIKNFAFSGVSSVKPGATVTVMNEDSEAHTVTADTGSAFGVAVNPGASLTFTAPSKPGTYAYHCTFHSNMHGSLTVK